MELQVTLDESDYFIDQVSYFKDAKLALDETAEGDWRRQEAYGGPTFDDLDNKVKTAFTEFLAERGFDNELSEYIPAYLDFKEQAEYVNWLEGVHSFVSAK